jgi:hypothetical protein
MRITCPRRGTSSYNRLKTRHSRRVFLIRKGKTNEKAAKKSQELLGIGVGML